MSRRWWTLAGAVALVAASVVPVTAASGAGRAAAPAAGAAKARRYVVMMAADPLVRSVGRKNLRTATARARAATLVSGQDAAMKAVGKRSSDKVYSYTRALNGFAVDLTKAQAEKLAKRGDVARVTPDALRKKTTDASPQFLPRTGREERRLGQGVHR